MKAIANTTIHFGLLALPAQVCQATESARDVRFDQAGPGGEALRQAYLDPQGIEVPRDQIVKGVRVSDTDFRAISAANLKAIDESCKRPDLQILEVIAREDVPMERVTGRYFIQSASTKKGGNLKGFKLFVDTLARENKAVVFKWTARSRQKLLVAYPVDGVLTANTLSFADDMRAADEAVQAHTGASYTDAEAGMGSQLLANIAEATQDANALDTERDEAIEQKATLREAAMNGEQIEAPEQVAPAAPVANLAELLTASLTANANEGVQA